jgi:CubicO group peptidase (beta-lactamase class C family)
LWNSPSLDRFVTRVSTLPLVRQPGIAFDYGISDDVLGALIQRASGMTFEEFLARRITKPLKLDDTFFDVPADKMARLGALHTRNDGKLVTIPPIIGAYAEPGRGFPSGGAGLFSTLRDYARFAQCLLDGGALDGTRILRRETVDLALKNSLPPGANAFDAATGWGLFSGIRLDVPSEEPMSPGSFTWSGAATTHFFADPKKRVVALLFAQHTPFDERQTFPSFRKAVYASLE